jgi:hypothetical protein
VPLLERLCQLLKEGEIRLCAYRLCRKALSPFLEYGSAIFFELDLAAISNQRTMPAPFLLFHANMDDAARLLKAVYFRFFGKHPIVLGMPARTLPTLVDPNASPALKEIPIATETRSGLA